MHRHAPLDLITRKNGIDRPIESDRIYLPRLFVYHCEAEPGSMSAFRYSSSGKMAHVMV
jgi:hypothetical protein